VFRYALERWETDPFQLIVVHEDKLPEPLEQALRALEPMLEAGSARPNWRITHVDTALPVPALWQGLWKQGETLPRLLLCTPEWVKGDAPLWTGDLTIENLQQLSLSPLRQQLRDELLRGTAVVWLVLDGTDQPAANALQSLVEKESERLVNAIMIPTNIGKDGVNMLSNLPIDVSFKTFRLRTDNTEESLLRSLVGYDPQEKQPVLIPLFGRGRALAAMQGSRVNPQLIEETARFLCGACSCQIKASNPGFDLLMAADWQSILVEGTVDEPKSQPISSPQYITIPQKK
jgi:hypothetical protein